MESGDANQKDDNDDKIKEFAEKQLRLREPRSCKLCGRTEDMLEWQKFCSDRCRVKYHRAEKEIKRLEELESLKKKIAQLEGSNEPRT